VCVMFTKILQVAKIFNEFGIPPFHDLLAVRMLLDMSWDEVRSAICSGMLLINNLPRLNTEDFRTQISRDLACGSLRIISSLPQYPEG
jgi:hypothetical protein